MDCKNALETAVDELGCRLNLFSDDVNEVLIPYFSDDVMEACEVTFPLQSKSDMVIEVSGGSAQVTLSQVVGWMSTGAALMVRPRPDNFFYFKVYNIIFNIYNYP